MMSILFIGLASHLRGGIVVWQRATETSEVVQHRRVAMAQLERDVANSFLYDPDGEVPPLPAFGAGGLSWVTVESPRRTSAAGDGAWARARYVSYRCDTIEGRVGLWRISRSIAEARAGLEGTSQLLLPGCTALAAQFAYEPIAEGGPLEWMTLWEDLAALPRLTEWTMEFASGEQIRLLAAAPAGVLGTRSR